MVLYIKEPATHMASVERCYPLTGGATQVHDGRSEQQIFDPTDKHGRRCVATLIARHSFSIVEYLSSLSSSFRL